jgi:hypothetical protein
MRRGRACLWMRDVVGGEASVGDRGARHDRSDVPSRAPGSVVRASLCHEHQGARSGASSSGHDLRVNKRRAVSGRLVSWPLHPARCEGRPASPLTACRDRTARHVYARHAGVRYRTPLSARVIARRGPGAVQRYECGRVRTFTRPTSGVWHALIGWSVALG